MSRRSRPYAVGLLGLVALVLSACQLTPVPLPVPTPTPTQTRPFTVVTTDQITATDPAGVTDQGSSVLSLNVFQRLMTAEPGQSALKPDAARDCLFTATTIYTCTLNDDEFFHNGHALTSSDVRFSILRAIRLNVRGSSAALLGSLERIETPDPVTIRFVLRRVDTQFGWSLASPAASIVDEEIYPAARLQTAAEPIVGSGPFSVTSFGSGRLTLQRYVPYVGKTPAQVDALVYRTVADSAAIEEAVNSRTADVAGRGLSQAALTRYRNQLAANADRLTDTGYAVQTYTGTRVRMLVWSPSAADAAGLPVREAIARALQPDRTLDSVVPGGVPGHTSAFAMGGRPRDELTGQDRRRLTLGYDPTMPDGADVADQVRNRLEATGDFTVTLTPRETGDADLVVVDRKAWTATGLAWLQPYLTAPPVETSSIVATLWTRYVSETDEPTANRTLAALQRQAAIDVTVVPLTQSDETLLVRQGTTVPDDSFGPGWQLGFFWMRHG